MTLPLEKHPPQSVPPPSPPVSGIREDREAGARILRAAARGETEAFSELFNQYSSLLLALATRIVGNREDAEEALQDALLYAWKRAGTYDPAKSSVSTWLVLITRSRCLDRLRLRKTFREARNELERETRGDRLEPVGFARAFNHERREKIHEALAGLPDSQREVLELRYYEGLTQAEVAERTGAPLGTVKTRSLLAMKKLKSELSRESHQLL